MKKIILLLAITVCIANQTEAQNFTISHLIGGNVTEKTGTKMSATRFEIKGDVNGMKNLIVWGKFNYTTMFQNTTIGLGCHIDKNLEIGFGLGIGSIKTETKNPLRSRVFINYNKSSVSATFDFETGPGQIIPYYLTSMNYTFKTVPFSIGFRSESYFGTGITIGVKTKNFVAFVCPTVNKNGGCIGITAKF